MTKRIKFTAKLVPLIFSGDKTATWRLFDDKELSIGDVVDCLVAETGAYFATIELIDITEKPLGKLIDDDWSGHERFENDEAMYEAYRTYYPDRTIGPETLVKIVRFKLLEV